jgi:hypothetical protein
MNSACIGGAPTSPPSTTTAPELFSRRIVTDPDTSLSCLEDATARPRSRSRPHTAGSG